MQNPKPFDTKRFLIIATIMLVIWHGMDLLSPSQRHSAISEAQAEAKGLIALDEATLTHALGKQDKPTLLFIYASWCGYCQHQHPIIDEFMAKHAKKANLLAVSIDDDPQQIASFLLQKPTPLLFKPYVANSYMLKRVLATKGGEFGGGIPYLAFFSAKGELTAQLAGLSDLATLNEGLARAQSVD